MRRRKTKKARKFSWSAIKRALSSGMKKHHLHMTCASSMKQTSGTPLREFQSEKHVCQGGKSLESLMRITYTASDFIDRGNHMTPTRSPRENLSAKWREIHGQNDWENILNPIHPWLRREIVKYGEFAQATYDAFDYDSFSDFCGSCRYNRHKLFDELHLTKHGYKVTKYIYSMTNIDVPRWLERPNTGETWSKDSNWMGYVAVSGDSESQRIGRRDIAVAWRGTVAPSEWFSDIKTSLEPIGSGGVKVQCGFHGIYTCKSEATRYNKLSAAEQVMQELKRLLDFFKGIRGEEVSLTVTGHSLGGALALLTAYDAASSLPGFDHISVISFGAPRVGNIAFRDKMNEMGVKILRVVIQQDIVPKLPGIIINKILRQIHSITSRLKWVYRHVGTELKLDMSLSPYLKQEFDLAGFHNLEIYLHLTDGYAGKKSKFRWNARRDLALVNKCSDMLIEELRIPEFWFQVSNKGLVFNSHGRWVKPCRDQQDIPSPFGEAPKLDFTA